MAWLLYPLLAIGLACFGWGWGLWRMVADGRRILYGLMLMGGLGLTLFSIGVLLAERGWYLPLVALLGIVFVVTVVSYPVLMVFLLVNGVMMWRRESRTLGNMLSLLAGLAMLGLTLLPQLTWPHDWPIQVQAALTGLYLCIMALAGYVALCFVVFAGTSWLYRRLPLRFRPEAIIVLGAGLLGGDRVPPLLAGRLAKAREVQDAHDPRPLLITSGGQGPDETLPEGEAMRRHVIQAGTPAELVVAETRSRNTRENLVLSRELLPDAQAPVVVVTSNYHAFRAAMLTRAVGLDAKVVGAPTARYYYPSALLREFVAVMVQNRMWNLTVVAVVLLGYVALIGLAVWPW